MSRKIVQEFRQAKQSLSSFIKKKWVVYNFKCDQCDACYVGNTHGDLFLRVDGHESKTLSVPNTRIIDTQAGFRMTIAINNNLYLFNNLYLTRVTPITTKYFL